MKRKQEMKSDTAKAAPKKVAAKARAGAAKAAPVRNAPTRIRVRITLTGDALAAYEALKGAGIDPSAVVSAALAEFSSASLAKRAKSPKSFSSKVEAK